MLRDEEAILLETLLRDVRDPLLYRENEGDDVESLLRETIKISGALRAEIDTATFYRLFYFIHRDFRGTASSTRSCTIRTSRMSPVTATSCPLRLPTSIPTSRRTSPSKSARSVRRPTGLTLRPTHLHWRPDGRDDPARRLPGRTRAGRGGDAACGSAFTIRKYADGDRSADRSAPSTARSTSNSWPTSGSRSNTTRACSSQAAPHRGKTTSMNAISMFIPPRSKVVTIEDTRELQLSHDNWLSPRSRASEFTRNRRDDVRPVAIALRHRPGTSSSARSAARSDDALQAMNTGHDVLDDARRFGADSHQPARERADQRSRSMVQSLDVLAQCRR